MIFQLSCLSNRELNIQKKKIADRKNKQMLSTPNQTVTRPTFSSSSSFFHCSSSFSSLIFFYYLFCPKKIFLFVQT